ncbi:MAG TPA: oligosaccharide flippase family protein [Candidatus Saccharimonadales bacterium]|nr:oligosaccharide flippase family protein [Candidatus Saccharimonadales bacterium]
MSIFSYARSSNFIRHNGIFFFGAVAVGALNYVYYPVMGRLLDTISFGEVQTLISLFVQSTIFLSVLGLVTVNIVANYRSTEQRDMVVREFEQLALLISVVLAVVAVVFAGQLAHFLHFHSEWPFVLLMASMVVSVPFTFRSAFLRGRQQFGLVSAGNLISAGGKLLFAVLFVLLGFGTKGAIGGLAAAQLVAFGLIAYWATKAGLSRASSGSIIRLPKLPVILPELRYGMLVLIGSLIITLQYSIDIVVVKHYFDPHTAGLYAGVATVARTIFFATASIAMVLMSMVRLDAKPGVNRALGIKSVVMLVAVALPITIVCVVQPDLVVSTLMGKSYIGAASLLPRLSITIFVISLLNVIVSYYLALRRFAITPLLLVGATITYVLVLMRHATLGAVVNNLLIGSLSMLVIFGIWIGAMRVRSV